MKFDIPLELRLAFRESELSKYDRDYFTQEYWKEDLPGISGNRGLSYNDPEHIDRFELIASAICDGTKFSSALDAGCGPGGLLAALQGAPIGRLVGVDASAAAISICDERFRGSRKVSVSRSNLAELPFSDGEFDLVVCLDVLEHIPIFDVGDVVRQLFRVSANTIIFSINSDNPYRYHPTILSSETWRVIFSGISGWMRDEKSEDAMNRIVKSRRPEYDFYCYSMAK